jgi:Uncharacterized protein conserved in bacteria (DUF2090)
MPRGYDRALYIQPFDHRGSFQAKLFGWKEPLSDAQTAEFGAAILKQATAEDIVTACPAEKSGQKEFDFEYGEDFARHIETVDPTFCKVLVRYNPEGDRALNRRQAARLKRLSDFSPPGTAVASCSNCWYRRRRRSSRSSRATRRPMISSSGPA